MIKYPFRQVGDADKRQKFEIGISGLAVLCVLCDSVAGIWWDDDSEYKTWW